MDRFLKTLKSTSVKLSIAVLAIVLVLAIFIDITIHDQGIYLIFFVLAYVLLPGFLFIVALDKDIFKRFRALSVNIAFYCGFALLIGQYYLLNLLGLLSWIRLTPLILIALLAFPAIRNIRLYKISFDKTAILDSVLPYISLIAITLVASYVVLKSTMPDTSAPIHIDYAYHMGNVNILTRGGSLEDTRVMGMTFKYHYFMDLFYAVLRLVFPAGIWNCIFRYSILFVSPLAAVSIFSFAKSTTKKPFYSFILSLFIILFPSISQRILIFPANMLFNFNNVGFAVPMAISLAQLFIFSAKKETYKYTDLAFIFLIMLVLSGTKGPFALILVGSMLIFVLYCLIAKRKLSIYQALAFLSALISFLIVWFSLLNMAINDQNLLARNQGLLKYFDYLVLLDGAPFLQNLTEDPKFAFLTIPISLVECFGASAIPFLLMIPVILVCLFRRKKNAIDYNAIFNTICVCVSVGSSILLALGPNRSYFLMMATPFIYMSAFSFLDLSYRSRNRIILIFNRLLIVISIVLLGISVICSVNDPVKFTWSKGPRQEELDGIAWIKENCDENALFAINDHSPNEKFYYYSAFTERRFYIESYIYASNSGKTKKMLEPMVQINEKLFSSNDSAVIADELGIDYFIYYDTTGKTSEILENNYYLCFSNEILKIYSRTPINGK